MWGPKNTSVVHKRLGALTSAVAACLLLAACSGSGGGGRGTPAYTIGGNISGLLGTVVLQGNSGDRLSVSANGPFTFAAALANGAGYSVRVSTQPVGQVCSVANGAGTVGNANVTDIAITCAWGVPSLVINDLIYSRYDMQLAGDGVGNMFLAAPWATISPNKVGVAVFQKPLGSAWGPQFEISPIKTISVPTYVSNFIKPRIRADSAGNAVATWIDMDNSIGTTDRDFLSNLYVQNYDKVTGWSSPILMQSDPTGYVISEDLTVQAGGTAWVVWTERTYKDQYFSALDKYALFAAEYTPLVGWGAAEKVTADYAITPPSVSYPDGRITTDNNGNPTILWTDGTTLYATRRTAGVWGSSDVVVAFLRTPGVTNVILDFDIAVDGSGNAIAVWQRWNSTGLIKTVYSNRYVANTGWTGVTTMSDLFFQNADAVSPKLAMDSSGNAFVLWGQFDGFMLAIWSARFDHILGWQTPTTISSSSEFIEGPQIGVDKLGNAVAIWSQYDARLNNTLIRACRYDSNTGWGEDGFISNGNGVARYPQLAVSGEGHATAIWAQDDVGNESFKMWSNDFGP